MVTRGIIATDPSGSLYRFSQIYFTNNHKIHYAFGRNTYIVSTKSFYIFRQGDSSLGLHIAPQWPTHVVPSDFRDAKASKTLDRGTSLILEWHWCYWTLMCIICIRA